jgi:hypothetical protein
MGMRMGAFVMVFRSMAVGEDYDFVDAEDGEGAGYVTAERGSKFMGLCAVWVRKTKLGSRRNSDFAIILPGRATLTVQSLPLVGLKIAVGLVVSSSAGLHEMVPLGTTLVSDWRFRFCITSAVFQDTPLSQENLPLRLFLLYPS